MLLTSFFWAALLAWPVGPDADPNLVVLFTEQSDAPVRIVSLKKTLRDQLAEITVENASEKVVSRYQLGWVIIKPSECPGRPMEPIVNLPPREVVGVGPGNTDSTGSYGLRTRQLLELAVRENTNLLLVQVGVVRVEFEDGSNWTYDLAEKKIFDPRILDFYRGRCGPTSFDLNRSGTHFSCCGVFVPIWCENHFETCTLHICKDRNDCPYQECCLNPGP